MLTVLCDAVVNFLAPSFNYIKAAVNANRTVIFCQAEKACRA